MNLRQHIKNKIAATSDDEVVGAAISTAIGLLDRAAVKYAILGSCGLQSYFKCCFRLPNDLDVILPEEKIGHVGQLASKQAYVTSAQLGRSQLIINRFPVHLIPYKMNVIDKDTNKVFTRVDLTTELVEAKTREIRFLNSNISIRGKVLSAEAIIFVELIRPLYTGSVMNVALATRDLKLSPSKIIRLLRANPDVRPIIIARLKAYPAAIKRVSFLRQMESRDISLKFSKLASILAQE